MNIAFILSKELEKLKNFRVTFYNLHFINNCDFYPGQSEFLSLVVNDYDYVFFDMDISSSDSLKSYKQLKNKRDQSKIILLSNKDTFINFRKMNEYGINGIIAKDLPTDEIVSLIVDLLNSLTFHIPVAEKTISPKIKFNTLTDREKQILKLFINGFSYKEVGNQLDVRLDTVRSHIRNIYRKLNVRSKTEAVLKVIDSNIIN
jgi:DNA-binding NarL/FixJ family response regulator